MRLLALSRMLLLVALLPVPTLVAQHVIHTKAGDALSGTLLSDDGKSITFRTMDGLELTMPYGDLDAQTVYRLMDARTGKIDGPGQVRVGDQAAAAGLFDAARKAYNYAVTADAALGPQVEGKLASLREAASNSLLAEAKQEIGLKHPDAAAQSLTTLLHEFPDEPAAKEGGALLDKLRTDQAAARSQSRAKALSQEVQDALAPQEKHYALMGKKINEGLQKASNQTAAIDEFKGAIDIGKSSRHSLASLKSQSSTIQGLAAAIDQLDQEFVAETVNAYIQLANVYNQRSSYNDATTAVNAGLALQPDNQQLLQLRGQIASNSAEGGGYVGWGGRGGRVPTPPNILPGVPDPHRPR
jgi:tetratricopeptide (TPR) repeat protein